ncbi:unnamed protein product [Closterium sp. NIES-53]
MSQPGTCSHDHDCSDHDCGAGFSLYKNVDLPKIRALNEAVEGSAEGVFRSWEDRMTFPSQPLDSNEDDPELILFIPFTTDVKIKSIAIIGGADGTSPAKLRAFTNREDIDFSVVNDLTAVQEWDLTENLQGELEYTTKFSKFQGVSSLTLHFPSNFGGDFSRIHFVGLKGEATQNNRRAVAAVVYEAQANPSDHEVPADMGVPKSFDASSIGVCWGRVAWQPLPPRIVVKLLQDNKISKVKLFNADPQVMKALVGSKLEVTVMVANELLNDMAMSPKKAQDWVDYNVKRYAFPGGADIRYVSVGNEPFLTWDNGEYNLVLAPAVQNIYDSLKAAGLDQNIKVTVAFNADVMGTSYPPSKASFRPDIANQMRRIVSLFSETGAPFSVNIYPFLNLYQQPGVFTMGDIFLDRPNERNFTDPGTGLVYTNVFDSTYDAILTALSRIGFPDLQIIIGEIGWPSDAQGSLNAYANNSYAQEFNNAIIQHMLSGSGTPLRPAKQIGGFIFGLLDEDMKSTLPGTFERHWGIFRADGTLKYNLDLTGKGNPNAQLVPAKDVAFFLRQCQHAERLFKETLDHSDTCSLWQYLGNAADMVPLTHRKGGDYWALQLCFNTKCT